MYSSGSLGPFLLCQRSSSAVTNKSTFSSVCKPLNLALALQQNLVQLFISTWPQALKTSQHSDYGSAYFIAYIYIMMLSTSTCSSSTIFQFDSYCLSKELLWWKLAYRFLFLQWWMSFGIHVSMFSWNLLNILKLWMAIKKDNFIYLFFFLVSLKVKYCAVLMSVLNVFPLTAVPGPYFWCSSHGPSLFNSLSTIFIFSHHSPSLWAFLVATIWSVTACQPFNALALLSVWDHGTACCAVVFWSSNANMQFKAPYKHQ